MKIENDNRKQGRRTLHYRRLERMYASGNCNLYYQPVIEIGRGRAKVTIEVRPDFFHSGGAVHGTVYFKALDDAAFFAVNALVDDVLVLTTSFHIHMLRPVSRGTLVATGEVVSAGRTYFVAEARLADSRGRAIARGSGTFVKGKVPLTPEIGYL